MKIQIDTSAKTIRIEEGAKLIDLFAIVKKLLPNDEWKQYSLEHAIIYNWWNPITIPYQQPFITWCADMNETVLTTAGGTLNFEIN